MIAAGKKWEKQGGTVLKCQIIEDQVDFVFVVDDKFIACSCLSISDKGKAG